MTIEEAYKQARENVKRKILTLAMRSETNMLSVDPEPMKRMVEEEARRLLNENSDVIDIE